MLLKGQSRILQSSHSNAGGPRPKDEIPTPQDFNAGGFNAAGTPKRAKVAIVLHFFNAGGDFNAGGEFQRQRISTPNSGIEDPLGLICEPILMVQLSIVRGSGIPSDLHEWALRETHK